MAATIEPEPCEGERVLRDPGVVDINKSDLDANRSKLTADQKNPVGH